MFQKIWSVLKKLLPDVKAAAPTLIFLSFVLINIIIWWFGAELPYGEQRPLASSIARIMTMVMFTLSCFSLWGFLQWRRLQSIETQQQHEEKLQQDPIKRMEERQEMKFNDIMQEMKHSLNKSNYLYTLPWYLVMGLENAGKTSLINRSGQTFAFSSNMRTKSKRQIENPFSFDWWIGDKSVLIDPDGELLTQQALGNTGQDSGNGEMERRLWLHFVKWLESTRSRRPLNGVVLAIDIASLATATVSERKVYANVLRARLRELMETLSTRMPVYVTLTKLDLLYGFEPFFRHLSKTERDRVLGFTFSMNSVTQADQWLEEYDTEFTDFVSRINQLLPGALASCYEQSEKTAIYSFSRQIAGLNDVTRHFLEELLSSDQFSTTGLVRGVYLTSVFQQGVPTNAFVDAASRRYGLSHPVLSGQMAKNSTTYFSQNLFNNIIYPEAGLASDNYRVVKRKRRLMWLSIAACTLASVLLVGSWHRYYLVNVARADAVVKKVHTYQENFSDYGLVDQDQDILKPLDTIRDATLEFGYFREFPEHFSELGLYQGHLIGPEIEKTYLWLLESRYLPALMKQVVVDMLTEPNDEAKLERLRVYRMLTAQVGRRDNMVKAYFASEWQKTYQGNRLTQESLMQHLDYALKQTDLKGKRQQGDINAEKVMKPYDQLVKSMQLELGKLPVEQRVYRNFKLNSELTLGSPINLSNAIGPVFDLVFNARTSQTEKFQIPKILTEKGFHNYFTAKTDAISELALLNSWVLGETQNVDFSEQDKEVLREKIRELYIADYTQTWREAMNEVDVKHFSDINSAVLTLDNIVSNTKPFSRLLNVITDNTNLFPNVAALDDSAKAEIIKSPGYKLAAMIDTQFSELNGLIEDQDDNAPPYMDEVMNAVGQLQTYMKAINDAPDVGKAALDATKSRIDLSNADPIYVLQRVAAGLPAPFNGLIRRIADQSWYVVKQQAIGHLENKWHKDVYLEYKEKLASRYPFNLQAKKDVALEDFESFFAPGGTLDDFYQKNLKLFLEEDFGIATAEEAQSLIRPDVMAQLDIAESIRSAFFNRKGILDVQFALEPLELSSNKRRSVINVDGQYIEYSHGPQKVVELVWPNTLRESPETQLTLIPNETDKSPRSINILGPWAFFRLLDKGEVVGASTTSVDYAFKIDEGKIQYRLHSEAHSNPFTQSLFNNFSLNKTLY
jgi:type VI secretion system protein ImpL